MASEGMTNPNWNGAPTQLAVNDSVMMPQTPNGSLVIGYLNRSKLNNEGTLTLTSGGSFPVDLDVSPLLRMFYILVGNWQANNLTLTNTSQQLDTPILVEAFGPGIPGVTPANLQINVALQLAVAQAAQTISKPNWMMLRLTGNQSATLATLAIVGGPLVDGNNAYVIALNSISDTGPPTQNEPPAGYYATTTGNSYEFKFNWPSATIFVVNMSSQTATPVTVRLLSL
jgi:hypothetical protein